MRLFVIAFLILLLLAVPKPPAAAAMDNTAWVPAIAVGAVVVGAIIYLDHRAHGGPAEVKTAQQDALDLIEYLAESKDLAELQTLTTKEEIDAFLERFFKKWDPTPQTRVNEFQREYTRRFRYVNGRYREGRKEGWKTDRGRVYMLFGAPEEVIETSNVKPSLTSMDWKAVEFWQYAHPAGAIPLPVSLQDPGLFESIYHTRMPQRGEMLFVFADETGAGNFREVFSTEPGERTDSSIYNQQ